MEIFKDVPIWQLTMYVSMWILYGTHAVLQTDMEGLTKRQKGICMIIFIIGSPFFFIGRALKGALTKYNDWW